MTSTLDFEEFSWKDGEGGYKGVSASNFGALYDYMRAHYSGVITIEERTPYLTILCSKATPSQKDRPFLIAGLLAIWLVDDVPYEFEGGYLGNLEIQLQLDSDYTADIVLYHIPRTKTLWQLMRERFRDAVAVSFISNEIFIELPTVPAREHAGRLRGYPGWFAHGERPSVFYHNGVRIRTSRPEKGVGRSRRRETEGKKLLGSDELVMDDVHVIDNAAVGCQGAMLCKGKTVVAEGEVVMGIFATSDAMGYGDPGIRAGCTGSALVKLEKGGEDEGGLLKRSTEEKEAA
ncbi:hypothetical protein V495_07007 [Pseudogymnoascus sp. VKM F-4514 (FW-929)]|nr:hypothetical protein V495_07007 [Pseudogymnoascus sp. VKM F-4514 (FW-929)]KFY68065.1 hypothetical protein V497_00005 [Pseudogymnoascus sp. VKM F-4516 (FW-969)]